MDSHLHGNDEQTESQMNEEEKLHKGFFVTTVPGYYRAYVGERGSVPATAQALCHYKYN